MRTWILFSTLAFALPLAACGDDTGGSGGGGTGGSDAASTADAGSTTTTADASSSSGASADVEVISPCTDDITPDAENTNVGSTDFSQPDITIPVGGVVRFAPTGPHNMTAIDDSWGTTTSAEACIRFNVAGTYDYDCSVHPAMLGTVTVQ